MNDLTIIKHDGVGVVESTMVAKAIEKEHKNLLADIRGYIANMEESTELKIQPSESAAPKFEVSDFFIPSTYTDPTGRTLPCYLLTKKGCDMVANKMTGKKGVLFTAAYITAFEQMRQRVQSEYSGLSPQLQLLINIELAQKEQAQAIAAVNQRVDDIRDVVALSPNSWRPDARSLINRIAQKWGGNEFIRDVQAEIFKLVDERAGASLETRLTNKRRRMADDGVCKSKRDKLNKVDVIADDKKLIEIYVAIVKEMAVKYGVTINREEI